IEIKRENERQKQNKRLPFDVTGYQVMGKNGQPDVTYAALWVEGDGDDDAWPFVGVPSNQLDFLKKMLGVEMNFRTQNALKVSDGQGLYSGVFGRSQGSSGSSPSSVDLWEVNVAGHRADEALIELTVYGAGRPPSARDRARANREAAEKTL